MLLSTASVVIGLVLVNLIRPGVGIDLGAAAGALAVTKAGAQPSLPNREEVEALLDYRGGLEQYHRDDAWRRGDHAPAEPAAAPPADPAP